MNFKNVKTGIKKFFKLNGVTGVLFYADFKGKNVSCIISKRIEKFSLLGKLKK